MREYSKYIYIVSRREPDIYQNGIDLFLIAHTSSMKLVFVL